MRKTTIEHLSLEDLVETGLLKLESLHPGGLELSRELAELCHLSKRDNVLDIASGTGETACFLAEKFDVHVLGIDRSDQMIQRSTEKAQHKGLAVEFQKADAQHLPFGDGMFDAAICECTLCLLPKDRVLAEMLRVVRPGGYVGMHDLCWKPDAPASLKRTLAEIEGEVPETLEGWQQLFHKAGMEKIRTIDKTDVKSRWIKESRKALGLTGQVALFWRIMRRWGFPNLRQVLQSEKVFSSTYLGYGMVVGKKMQA